MGRFDDLREGMVEWAAMFGERRDSALNAVSLSAAQAFGTDDVLLLALSADTVENFLESAHKEPQLVAFSA